MTEPETDQKSSVSISLPIKFLDFYHNADLWSQGFSSFSEWVRHALREQVEKERNRIFREDLEKRKGEVFKHDT